MYKVCIIKPRRYSNGAKQFCSALRQLNIKAGTVHVQNGALAGNRFILNPQGKLKVDGMIINWGNSFLPNIQTVRDEAPLYFNSPYNISTASNKLSFFQAMKAAGNGPYIPTFYTNYDDLPYDYTLVAREVLNGSGGAGIHIGEKEDLPRSSPLYTRYIKKSEEFRVHVGLGGDVIAIQRKALKREGVNRDDPLLWKIRNHARGFVFVRNDGWCQDHPNLTSRIAELGVRAINVCNLSFGAADIIYNEERDSIYVLEVNTAPGLEGQTANDYAAMVQRHLAGRL